MTGLWLSKLGVLTGLRDGRGGRRVGGGGGGGGTSRIGEVAGGVR